MRVGRITVDGRSYEAVEKLSFHQVGMPAVVVQDGTEERIAVKRSIDVWSWWTPEDRLAKKSVCEGQ